MAVWQRQARDGSGDAMRLRLEVTEGPKRVAGALVLDRRRKARDEKERVGRQAASEDINLQDEFWKGTDWPKKMCLLTSVG